MVSVERILSGKTLSPMDLAAAARQRRIGLDLSQEDLSRKSGVPLATLKRFEQIGSVSLASFIAICRALDVDERLQDLFPPAPPRTLDEVERGRAPTLRRRASPRRRKS